MMKDNWLAVAGWLTIAIAGSPDVVADERPNILFCIADDWGWPHAGAYGDPVVKTPTFDRLAREGVLFTHAFVSAPSCTPCRNSILTGQWFARLEEGANLWSTLHPKYAVYPLTLQEAGYHVGHWRKAWGPGDWRALGRSEDPAGPTFGGFRQFLDSVPEGQPFCFWLGTSDPHRPYQYGSGEASGMDLSKIRLHGCLPDHPEVRKDVADYYFEVQRWDSDVGAAIQLLKARGLLENTIIAMTGDHNMPFPRCKGNLYDSGSRVPLAIRWGSRVKPGRTSDDFVSLVDLAPTFLEAAGVPIPEEMTGRSLMTILVSERSGRIDPTRDFVLIGKERHGQAQEKPNPGGYPMRVIRTRDYLYIRNFAPDRWPGGAPDAAAAYGGNAFGDCDGGPTKTLLIEQRDDPEIKPFFELAFAKRPGEELYDLSRDAEQLENVAARPEYADVMRRLSEQLTEQLTKYKDPRVVGGADAFDTYPYRRPQR